MAWLGAEWASLEQLMHQMVLKETPECFETGSWVKGRRHIASKTKMCAISYDFWRFVRNPPAIQNFVLIEDGLCRLGNVNQESLQCHFTELASALIFCLILIWRLFFLWFCFQLYITGWHMHNFRKKMFHSLRLILSYFIIFHCLFAIGFTCKLFSLYSIEKNYI